MRTVLNNLTAGEIAAQALWARREAAQLPGTTPRRLTNVVFMGMGEAIGGCLLRSEAEVTCRLPGHGEGRHQEVAEAYGAG